MLFYHLIRFKKLPFLVLPIWRSMPDIFYIHKFYLSYHHPKSVFGIAEAIRLNIKSLSYKMPTWINWHRFKILSALKLVANKKHSPATATFSGRYKSHNSFVTIGIDPKDNKLFLLEGMQVTPLKQIKSQEFISTSVRCRLTFSHGNSPHFSVEDVFNYGFDKKIFNKLP